MDLRLNASLAQAYHGPTQITRVLSEDWFAREGYCVSCLHRPVTRLADNSIVADFRCSECFESYQLKARAVPFGNIVADGAYRTFYSAVINGVAPNLLLLHYDRTRSEVVDLASIPGKVLSPLSILKRNPLAATARRAGWVGCNLDLRSIPNGAVIPMVRGGCPLDESEVRARWNRFSNLEDPAGDVGWLRDTLTCIQKLGRSEFHLADIYAFQRELSELHPRNRHIEPKIRQQLQVLCSKGLVERVRPGLYRTTGGK